MVWDPVIPALELLVLRCQTKKIQESFLTFNLQVQVFILQIGMYEGIFFMLFCGGLFICIETNNLPTKK